ncbi:MAG: hypothetical protein JNL71_06930 [Rhodospirillales bacterium]|nr:hypothetical protein [Rhodospirillales bacterium]
MIVFAWWHVAAVFLPFLAIPPLVSWIALRVHAPHRPMDRRGYALRMLGLSGATALLFALLPELGADEALAAAGVAYLVALVLTTRWALARLADLGARRGLALLAGVPVAGLALAFWLALKRSPAPQARGKPAGPQFRK